LLLRKPILVYLSLQKSNSKEIPFLLSTSELVVPNRHAPTRESPKLGRACSCSQGLTKVERKSDYLSCGFSHPLASCLSRSFSEAIPTLKKTREKFHLADSSLISQILRSVARRQVLSPATDLPPPGSLRASPTCLPTDGQLCLVMLLTLRYEWLVTE
jgi:hypothetical protein